MTDRTDDKRESWLPRLSRASVFNPLALSATKSQAGRKDSDATNVSPMTSQVHLARAVVDESNAGDGGRAVSTAPLQLADAEQLDDETLRGHEGDETVEKRDSRNDSTSTSATGPAGSGMPPAEAAFTNEKEVVETDNSAPFDVAHYPGIRNSVMTISPTDSPRPVQSPRPVSALSQPGPLDATSMIADNVDSTAAQLARLGSSLGRSRSSVDMPVIRYDILEDANIMLQTAQTARMKRPSLINYPGTGSSGTQVPEMSRLNGNGDVLVDAAGLMPRSKSIAMGSLARERAKWSDSPSIAEAEPIRSARWQNVDFLGASPVPPNSAVTSDENLPKDEHRPKPSETLTLRDALAINPAGSSNMPKRSTTVPSSLRGKRARFSPLALRSDSPSLRETVVTTPYPKSKEDVNLMKDEMEEQIRLRGAAEERDVDVEDTDSYKFNLTITARNRSSTVTISQFEDEQPGSKFWWRTKRNDDERVIRMAHREYARLVGNVRSMAGAKTPKAVRLRFIRPDKVDYLLEPDTPLIGGRFGSIAETDLWRLWNDPVQGHKKRNWLNILTHNSKIFGASRAFVLEVTEGHDAARIIVASSVVTALSLIAMFFWLFLGVGGEGNTITIVDGMALQPTSSLTDVSARAGDAFLFGIWILFLGWTGVAGWIFAS